MTHVAVLALLLLTGGAAAESSLPTYDRARTLLAVGDPGAALFVLEPLPPTFIVLDARARAHMMIASRSTGAERCFHARQAREFASMTSDGAIVALARRTELDEGCELTRSYD